MADEIFAPPIPDGPAASEPVTAEVAQPVYTADTTAASVPVAPTGPDVVILVNPEGYGSDAVEVIGQRTTAKVEIWGYDPYQDYSFETRVPTEYWAEAMDDYTGDREEFEDELNRRVDEIKTFVAKLDSLQLTPYGETLRKGLVDSISDEEIETLRKDMEEYLNEANGKECNGVFNRSTGEVDHPYPWNRCPIHG